MSHVNISERSLVVGVLGILSLKFIIYKLVKKKFVCILRAVIGATIRCSVQRLRRAQPNMGKVFGTCYVVTLSPKKYSPLKTK